MSNFTPTKCYDLKKYNVVFDKIGISIIDNTGKSVDDRKFKDSFEIMIHNGDFCFGDITFSKSFDKTIDLNKVPAGVVFEPTTERIVGSSEMGDPGIAAHLYSIDLCPIKLEADSNAILTFTCPCDSSTGPCDNKCYKFGTWN